MDFQRSAQKHVTIHINEYGFHAPPYNVWMSKGLNGNMTCGNIDTRKRIFWRYFDDQIFLCTLNYDFSY